MMHYPIEDALPKIQAHALIIRGEYDAVAPRDWVRRMGDLLPSARLWEIPGAAHSVMHKQAEEVARLCVEHARESAGEDLPDESLAAATVAPDDDDASGSVPLRIADDVEREEAAPADPDDVIAGIRGRIVEAVGVIRDDDDLVERGKSEHAEALHKIENPDGSEKANVAGGAQSPDEQRDQRD